MGVGLALNGKRQGKKESELLAECSEWFETSLQREPWSVLQPVPIQTAQNHEGIPTLFLTLHPGSESIEIMAVGPDSLRIYAKTSTLGAGYHTALCRLLTEFGEGMDIQWAPQGEGEEDSLDETGYFLHGDRSAVEAEMDRQYKAMANQTIALSEEQGHLLSGWNMALDAGFADNPGHLQTPLGYRDLDWVRAVAADPAVARDIFAWWEEGFPPAFFRNRALARMWNHCFWRPPLTPEESETSELIHEDLETAFALDPSMDLPWREWLEILENQHPDDASEELEGTIREKARAADAGRPLVGFRRGMLTMHPGNGWNLMVPGSMALGVVENSWVAWDGSRTIRFSCWQLANDAGNPVPADELLDGLAKEPNGIPLDKPGFLGRAYISTSEEEDRDIRNLTGFTAVEGHIALCNIFQEDEDMDWALGVWKSVSHPGGIEKAE